MAARGMSPAKTVDEYLSRLDEDQRAALERLREIIRAALPKVEECISYKIPAFRLDGKVLVWFAAAKGHCSFFPGAVVQDFKRELARFQTSKGTVRFQPGDPLPATLIRKLLKARREAMFVHKQKPSARRR